MRFKMIIFNIKRQNLELVILKCVTYAQLIPLSIINVLMKEAKGDYFTNGISESAGDSKKMRSALTKSYYCYDQQGRNRYITHQGQTLIMTTKYTVINFYKKNHLILIVYRW